MRAVRAARVARTALAVLGRVSSGVDTRGLALAASQSSEMPARVPRNSSAAGGMQSLGQEPPEVVAQCSTKNQRQLGGVGIAFRKLGYVPDNTD